MKVRTVLSGIREHGNAISASVSAQMIESLYIPMSTRTAVSRFQKTSVTATTIATASLLPLTTITSLRSVVVYDSDKWQEFENQYAETIIRMYRLDPDNFYENEQAMKATFTQLSEAAIDAGVKFDMMAEKLAVLTAEITRLEQLCGPYLIQEELSIEELLS